MKVAIRSLGIVRGSKRAESIFMETVEIKQKVPSTKSASLRTPLLFLSSRHQEMSSISSSEKPIPLSLSLRSLFSSSSALRFRPISAMSSIEAAIRSGFRVYKHKIIAPIPSVAPSRNVFRAADFNFASSHSRITLGLLIPGQLSFIIPYQGNSRSGKNP